MAKRRIAPFVVAVVLATGPLIAACDSLDTLDLFDTKKKLPGERKPVFPEGVPGATSGVPAELVKGYREPEHADVTDPAKLAAEAAAQVEKPKPKPKPKAKPDPTAAKPPPQRAAATPGATPAPSSGAPPAQPPAAQPGSPWSNPQPQAAWPGSPAPGAVAR